MTVKLLTGTQRIKPNKQLKLYISVVYFKLWVYVSRPKEKNLVSSYVSNIFRVGR